MEYLKKCQTCPFFKSVACYGTQKGHKSGNCLANFREIRQKWVKNLPAEGRVQERNNPGEEKYIAAIGGMIDLNMPAKS